MITTIKVKGNFSPARTLTIAAGARVDFWSMQPQIGRPETTRGNPTSAITRQFNKVASINHVGDVGDRHDWRPHGSSFVQIVGGSDDKLWVASGATGVTCDVTVAGCTPTDCSTQYAQGYEDGKNSAHGGWQSWANIMAIGEGGEDVAGGTGTATSIPAAITTTQLLVANSNRLGFRIQNESNVPLYVKYGSAASLTSYAAKVLPDGWLAEDGYSGVVHGIWAAGATGNARVTEITP
jgi:hypothetical protein